MDKIIEAIIEATIEELLTHGEEGKPLYRDGDRIFTFDKDNGSKRVSWDKARAMITGLITKEYQTYGRIIVYTCKDVRTIDIDTKAYSQEEELNEPQRLTIGGKVYDTVLYMAFD